MVPAKRQLGAFWIPVKPTGPAMKEEQRHSIRVLREQGSEMYVEIDAFVLDGDLKVGERV